LATGAAFGLAWVVAVEGCVGPARANDGWSRVAVVERLTEGLVDVVNAAGVDVFRKALVVVAEVDFDPGLGIVIDLKP
jgi:hypothetical protein